jgi:hypothetical protein
MGKGRLDIARRGLEVGIAFAGGERFDVQPQAQR